MQKLVEEHKYAQKEFKKITKKFKGMSYQALLALFKDENFNDIIRHIRINLSECNSMREKIDMASALILGNLRKLNLQNKKAQALPESLKSSVMGSRMSIASKRSIGMDSSRNSISRSRGANTNSIRGS